MTTEVTWHPFPGRPNYQINNEGGLRTVDGTPVPLQTVPNGDACYYVIDDLRYSPDNLIDRYLPAL